MKKLIMLFAVLALFGGAFATQSRIESMGKSDRYMLDEMNMLTNPAYFLLYPNILTGSLGEYSQGDWQWTHNLSQQWYGAWMTVNNVAVGGAFNRKDAMETFMNSRRSLKNVREYGQDMYLIYRLDNSSWVVDTVPAADTLDAQYVIGGRRYFVTTSTGGSTIDRDTVDVLLPEAIGEVEGFLGYNLGNMGVGLHIYRAAQDSSYNSKKVTSTALTKFDLGLVMKLTEKDLVDVVLTGTWITLYGKDIRESLDEAALSIGMSARAFLTIPALGNGQIVPSFKISQRAVVRDTMLSVSPGIGYTREIEGGSFWGGFDYTYEKDRDMSVGVKDTTVTHTKTFSFGIEKQIAWPWFTLRVGGQKQLMDIASGTNSFNESNPDNDRSVDDLIGAGVTMKVGQNLKFDLSANERIPFSNLFYGDLANLASRIDATYSF